MSVERQTSLDKALDFGPSVSGETTIKLSSHLAFADSASGGYTAAILAKAAVLYASQHPSLQKQLDVRYASTTLFRPVFPSKSTYCVNVREVNVGKTMSVLRVEMFQGESKKPSAYADCTITDFSMKGITLKTNWQLTPAPFPANLFALENHTDPNWICYHTPFYPNGFRRAHSYIKYFLPTTWSPTQSHAESWALPGWDCEPHGSRDPSVPEARWTNETLPLILDFAIPVQENYFITKGERLPMGSVPSTLEFARLQKQAREEGKFNWRELPGGIDGDGSRPDGGKAFLARKTHGNVTVNMTVEVKRRLPKEGVRWLYLRSEVKSVVDSRMDLTVLCFDENLELVATRNGIEQLLPSTAKRHRKLETKAVAKTGTKL